MLFHDLAGIGNSFQYTGMNNTLPRSHGSPRAISPGPVLFVCACALAPCALCACVLTNNVLELISCRAQAGIYRSSIRFSEGTRDRYLYLRRLSFLPHPPTHAWRCPQPLTIDTHTPRATRREMRSLSGRSKRRKSMPCRYCTLSLLS